jgi:hypothetical protein
MYFTHTQTHYKNTQICSLKYTMNIQNTQYFCEIKFFFNFKYFNRKIFLKSFKFFKENKLYQFIVIK